MKKILFCLVVATALIACDKQQKTKKDSSEPEQYSVEEYGYKGNVRKVVEKKYEISFQTGELEYVGMSDFDFNDKGFIRVSRYEMSGGLVYQEKFSYDGDNCTQIDVVNEDLTNNSVMNIVKKYEYDKNGHCIKAVNQSSDDESQYFYYKYDGDNLVSLDMYSQKMHSGKILTQKIVYDYSSKGENVRYEAYDYDSVGNVAFRDVILYEYDDNGNVSEMKILDENDNVTSIYRYKYNGNGREIECAVYSPDGVVDNRIEYVYNEDDCCTETRSYINEELVSASLFKYDKYKNIVECVQINYETATKAIDTYEYEYDEHENIIKYSAYRDSVLQSQFEREIIYY